MKPVCALLLLALAVGSARAGDSLLRISCDGTDVGAEVLVNGKFKGECPVDIKVGAGALKVRVFKPIDRLRERAFEVEVRMAEDTVKRIDAVLEERLTAAGKIQEQAERAPSGGERAQAEAAMSEERRTYLMTMMYGIRLAATTCPDGQGHYYVTGVMPKQAPKGEACFDVHYEAMCPPNQKVITGVVKNFTGMGGCSGNANQIEPKPACDVRKVIIRVTGLRPGCN